MTLREDCERVADEWYKSPSTGPYEDDIRSLADALEAMAKKWMGEQRHLDRMAMLDVLGGVLATDEVRELHDELEAAIDATPLAGEAGDDPAM